MRISPQEAYALYLRAGQEPFLSKSEFIGFWLVLNEENEDYWLDQFYAGHTTLGRDLLNFGIFDEVANGNIDLGLMAAVETVLGGMADYTSQFDAYAYFDRGECFFG